MVTCALAPGRDTFHVIASNEDGVWNEARVIEDDQALTRELMPMGYKARPSQVIIFKVLAWDANCPQHIPQRLEAADVATALAERDRRIAEREAQVALLRTAGE